MGMTIENANKVLSVISSNITEDDDYLTIVDENLQVFKETLLTATETMRKYQKIVQIMERTVDDGTSMYHALQEIEEVVVDNLKEDQK